MVGVTKLVIMDSNNVAKFHKVPGGQVQGGLGRIL